MKTLNIHDSHLGCFSTATGVLFDLNNPTIEMLKVDDICIGLSNCCRYGGQIDSFYSVAQHSILVAVLAPYTYRRAALLHDASEAYIHDIIKPLKNIIGEQYMCFEGSIMELVCQKFNVNPKHMEMVKPWDTMALELEDAALRKREQKAMLQWNDLWKQVGYDQSSWLPIEARRSLNYWFKKNDIL